MLDKLFRILWPLGTTLFALIILTLLILKDPRAGLIGLGVYSGASILEWKLKKIINRKRPFLTITHIVMNQPRKPLDASFPSGDTFRAWFLAFSVPMVFHLQWPYTILFFLAASMIMLGRIAMGVHYPLDTIGGMGIGTLASGIYLLCLGHGI